MRKWGEEEGRELLGKGLCFSVLGRLLCYEGLGEKVRRKE